MQHWISFCSPSPFNPFKRVAISSPFGRTYLSPLEGVKSDTTDQSSSAAQKVPAEIYGLVASHCSSSTLLELALVNHLLQNESERILYRDIDIHHSSQLRPCFQSLLSSIRRQRYVRKLRINEVAYEDVRSFHGVKEKERITGEQASESWNLVPRTLAYLTGLKSLEFGYSYGAYLTENLGDVEAYDFLSCCNTTLKLTSFSTDCHVFTESLLAFLLFQPSITHLSIGFGIGVQRHPSIPLCSLFSPVSSDILPALEVLRADHRVATRLVSGRPIKELQVRTQPDSTDELSALCLSVLGSQARMSHLVLKLPCDPASLQRVAQYLPYLTSLVVIFSSPPQPSDALTNHTAWAASLSGFRSLRRLKILRMSISDYYELETLGKAWKSSVGRSLKNIDITSRTNVSYNWSESRERLMKQIWRRNLEVSTNNVSHFRRWGSSSRVRVRA